MKIVIIDSVSDLYGSSKICRLVSEILRESGHIVHVYARQNYLASSAQYASIITYPLMVFSNLKSNPFKFLFSLALDTFKFFVVSKKLFSDADLIYCNTLGTLPVCLIARLRGKRVLLHVHESNSFNPVVRWLAGMAISSLASQFIFVSHAIAKLWGLENHLKTRVVHNGIPDFIDIENVDKSVVANRKFHFLFIGRLIDKKGFFLFLKALQFLDDECAVLNRKISVAIVGGAIPGKNLPFSESELSQFHFIDVSYFGEVSDPDRFFLDSSVVCVPSTYADPYPTVVLEGLRAGCSVIASDIGGAPEALVNCNSSIFKSGDVMALKAAMLEQLKLLSIGNPCLQSRNVFCTEHGVESFGARILSVVHEKQRLDS